MTVAQIWKTEHSEETAATLAFSWTYMTDVKNWDDPPATFQLHGPFTNGSLGATEIPGQPARQWHLQDVRPHDSYTIVIALEGADLSCKWLVQKLAHDRTRLTQQVTLQGKSASLYQEDVQRTFAATLAPGMSRIATVIGKAYEDDQLPKISM